MLALRASRRTVGLSTLRFDRRRAALLAGLCQRWMVDTIVVDGYRIAFTLAGHGPPVILLGGFVGDGLATWRYQIEVLASTNSVLAWDAPGSGGSSDVPESFRLPNYADCLAGLVSVLRLEPAVVVGLSFGGALALEFFRRHRGLVRGLFLAGGHAGWAGSLPPTTVQARLDASLNASRLPPDQFGAALLPSMFSSQAPTERVEEFAAGIVRAFRPAGFRTMATASAEADLRDVLPQVDVPTVVLHADQDVRSLREVADALHAAIPNSRLVVLSGAGHVSCVEAPEQFNAAVEAFLRRTRSS
jgi:pimeloyl-ACP methyl ester carboxylesterase